MGEIRTVTTLRRKRKEIADSIRLYERQLEQARADLAHVTAAIRIFEASGDAKHLGSGLIDYSQKMTTAAMQIADMNV